MEILKAESYNFVEVLYLMNQSLSDMTENGIYQWSDSYPTPDRLKMEIEEGSIYLMKEKGISIGSITFDNKHKEVYKTIQWEDKSDNFLVIHRVVVYSTWQNKGIGSKLLDFAVDYAKKNEYISIRMDIYSPSKRLVKFIENKGFQYRGEIMFPNQRIPYNCYEKIL